MARGTPIPRTVAAFDFDGTLTRADTLIPFLQRLCGTTPVVRALATEAGSLARALANGVDRDAFKARVLARLLAGWSLEEVEDVVARYTPRVLEAQLRRTVVERVAWHRGRGHELVIVSASPELYVAPVARRLGFSAVLATRLEVDGGRLTGRLVGANVRGPEKVRRLRQHLGDAAAANSTTLWAYGDSRGDRELLAEADMAVRVTRRGLLLAAGPLPPP